MFESWTKIVEKMFVSLYGINYVYWSLIDYIFLVICIKICLKCCFFTSFFLCKFTQFKSIWSAVLLVFKVYLVKFAIFFPNSPFLSPELICLRNFSIQTFGCDLLARCWKFFFLSRISIWKASKWIFRCRCDIQRDVFINPSETVKLCQRWFWSSQNSFLKNLFGNFAICRCGVWSVFRCSHNKIIGNRTHFQFFVNVTMKIRCQCVPILAKRELKTAEPSAKQYNPIQKYVCI